MFNKMVILIAIILSFSISLKADNKIVSIEVSPGKIDLAPNQLQRFIARGFNADGKEIPFSPVWTSTGGEISEYGWFKAKNKGFYMVMANDSSTGAQGTASVFVKQSKVEEINAAKEKSIVKLKLYPSRVSLKPGETVKFKIVGVTPFQREYQVKYNITWRVSGGSITRKGLYEAGQAPGDFRVEVINSQGLKAVAKIKISAKVTDIARIKIQPKKVKLKPGDDVRFFAVAYNSMGNPVGFEPIWEATGGKMDQYGIYKAGEIPGLYYVKVYGPNGVSTTASIEIEYQNIIKVKLVPEGALLYTGQKQSFSATAYDSYGKEVPVTPTWTASGGIITANGTYFAGNTPGDYIISVTVGRFTATAQIVVKRNLAVRNLVVSPAGATLRPGQRVNLKVQAYDSDGFKVDTPKITWEISGGNMTNQGVYTAGNVPGQYKLKVSVPNGTFREVMINIMQEENKEKEVKIIKKDNNRPHKHHKPHKISSTGDLEVVKWEKVLSGDELDKLAIVVRVKSEKAAFLKIMVYYKHRDKKGKQVKKALTKRPVKIRYMQRVRFNVSYIKSITEAVGLILYDKHKNKIDEYRKIVD